MIRRKGSALVLFAVGLTTFLMFLALVIDVGFWYQRRAQVQLNGDLAVLSAMGSINLEWPLDQQRVFVRNTALAILRANGYEDSQWSIDPQPNTTGGTPNTYVGRTFAVGTTVLPTFFLNVWTAAKPTMRTISAAEGIRQKAKLPPCGFVAKNLLSYGGGGGAGGLVDSFDSSDGRSYQPSQLENSVEFFDKANAVGCGNAQITYNGNVKQYGSLYSHSNIVISGGAAIVRGDVDASTTINVADGVIRGGSEHEYADVPHFTLPPVVAPEDIATNNLNGTIRIYKDQNTYDAACPPGQVCNGACTAPDCRVQAGTELILNGGEAAAIPAGGNYYFTRVRATGNANLYIVGDPALAGSSPTKLYVNGEFDATGGIEFNKSYASGLGPTQLNGVTAMDLQILGMPGCTDLRVGGGTKIVADIFAPDATVSLQGSQHTFGRIRANNINIDGTASFTFDEALGFGNVDTDTFDIKVHLTE